MAIQKQNINLNFNQGINTKTDDKQVQIGQFLSLNNSVFQKGGLLQKRNGFGSLPSLSNDSITTLGTYSSNLIAIGNSLNVLSEDSNQWLDKGYFQTLGLDTVPMVRTSTSQTSVDTAVASNGLACSVYLDSSNACFYQINDSVTGQVFVSVTALPSTSTIPRVFALGNYFVITFLVTVSATTHLKYIAIPINDPTHPGSATDLSTQAKALTAGYDGYVSNSNLYIALDGSDGGGAIRITYIDSTLTQHGTVVIAGKTANLMSVTADESGNTPVIWVTFWNSGASTAYSVAYSQTLVSILSATLTINGIVINNLTSSAVNGVLKIFYQVTNNYSYMSTRSDYIQSVTCSIAGSVGTPGVVLRSVGLASKSFYLSSQLNTYLLASYGGSLQPSYFLIDSSGNVISKLAYSNGAGYYTHQVLPGVNLIGDNIKIGYLLKDQIFPVNKDQGVAAVAGIYAQTGINLVSFTITNQSIVTTDIANDLHLSGGFLWMYDGVKPVEHGFHLWPEDIKVTTATTGGLITDQQYYYYATYEWTDSQGNIHRSAPSIPVGIVTAGGNTSTNTINIPTLRLTYKLTPNKVKLCIYRWSAAQQIPYLITSITSPTLNDTTVDSISYTDTAADSSILGNLILYTNGGIIENIAAPACSDMTLFRSRLFLIDSEDKNLLWYSKQVIEQTPVEMSDLFTLYVAPTTGVQGSTGPITALSAMDDKLIIFKKDAIYYVTGNGPDNTGANNDFSEPVFITSSVGCSNPSSIVFIPNGLMFQSDKGIWILGRDLSTNYIGAPVELYNSALIKSAVSIPATNQVRFSLDTGLTLMFDYYYNQWGTFSNVPSISNVIYQSLHTYLKSDGSVLQETPGQYLDAGAPVLLSFTTSWINLMGVQGFERAYWFYLIGQYLTPHKLGVSIAYDYNPYPTQISVISPDNFSQNYGNSSPYGAGVYGGVSGVEQWRVFLQNQKCESFQITINEIFDPSFGVIAGAGLTLSGINLVVGAKSGYPRLKASNQVG